MTNVYSARLRGAVLARVPGQPGLDVQPARNLISGHMGEGGGGGGDDDSATQWKCISAIREGGWKKQPHTAPHANPSGTETHYSFCVQSSRTRVSTLSDIFICA